MFFILLGFQLSYFKVCTIFKQDAVPLKMWIYEDLQNNVMIKATAEKKPPFCKGDAVLLEMWIY